MSYDIYLFHPSVRQQVEQGRELDEFNHPPLDSSAVEKFINNLAAYGYRLESTTPECRSFIKNMDGCPIQVSVFTTEIAFTIPYWENSQDAIREALQDACDIPEPEAMVLFDPQTGEWTDI